MANYVLISHIADSLAEAVKTSQALTALTPFNTDPEHFDIKKYSTYFHAYYYPFGKTDHPSNTYTPRVDVDLTQKYSYKGDYITIKIKSNNCHMIKKFKNFRRPITSVSTVDTILNDKFVRTFILEFVKILLHATDGASEIVEQAMIAAKEFNDMESQFPGWEIEKRYSGGYIISNSTLNISITFDDKLDLRNISFYNPINVCPDIEFVNNLLAFLKNS